MKRSGCFAVHSARSWLKEALDKATGATPSERVVFVQHHFAENVDNLLPGVVSHLRMTKVRFVPSKQPRGPVLFRCGREERVAEFDALVRVLTDDSCARELLIVKGLQWCPRPLLAELGAWLASAENPYTMVLCASAGTSLSADALSLSRAVYARDVLLWQPASRSEAVETLSSRSDKAPPVEHVELAAAYTCGVPSHMDAMATIMVDESTYTTRHIHDMGAEILAQVARDAVKEFSAPCVAAAIVGSFQALNDQIRYDICTRLSLSLSERRFLTTLQEQSPLRADRAGVRHTTRIAFAAALPEESLGSVVAAIDAGRVSGPEVLRFHAEVAAMGASVAEPSTEQFVQAFNTAMSAQRFSLASGLASCASLVHSDETRNWAHSARLELIFESDWSRAVDILKHPLGDGIKSSADAERLSLPWAFSVVHPQLSARLIDHCGDDTRWASHAPVVGVRRRWRTRGACGDRVTSMEPAVATVALFRDALQGKPVEHRAQTWSERIVGDPDAERLPAQTFLCLAGTHAVLGDVGVARRWLDMPAVLGVDMSAGMRPLLEFMRAALEYRWGNSELAADACSKAHAGFSEVRAHEATHSTSAMLSIIGGTSSGRWRVSKEGLEQPILSAIDSFAEAQSLLLAGQVAAATTAYFNVSRILAAAKLRCPTLIRWQVPLLRLFEKTGDAHMAETLRVRWAHDVKQWGVGNPQAAQRYRQEFMEWETRDDQRNTGLALASARPRGSSLSEAERRVAELVAVGHTNRSVAEQLFLSKRTVDTHLRNIYRKLGVTGRDELAKTIQTTD